MTLLGIGWLTIKQEPPWSEGVAHWPIMFKTRKRAREEVHVLNMKYRYFKWKFRVTRLEVTYRAN